MDLPTVKPWMPDLVLFLASIGGKLHPSPYAYWFVVLENDVCAFWRIVGEPSISHTASSAIGLRRSLFLLLLKVESIF